VDRIRSVSDSTGVKDRKPPITVVPRRERNEDGEEIVVRMPEGFFARIVDYARNGPPPMVERPLARQAEVEREISERLAGKERVAEAKRRATK